MLSRRSPARFVSLIALAFLSTIFVVGVYMLRETADHPHKDTMLEAAQRMQECLGAIRQTRIERGPALDPANDPNLTGVIGVEFSEITTTLGNPEAKRTTLNPDFAALIVRFLTEVGVESGDAVGMGFSGSFPGLCIASICAAEAMEARPIVISSVGASSWGANIPELTWLDMEKILGKADLIQHRTLAVTIGAEADTGGGLTEEGRALLLRAIERNGVGRLLVWNLEESVEKRVGLYKRLGPIRVFINVGGAQANIGSYECAATLRPGINSPSSFETDRDCGVAHRLGAMGVPVIHLLNIRQLAAEQGLAFDPVPLPRPGHSEVYSTIRYRPTSIWLSLGVVLLAGAVAARVCRVGFRSPQGRQQGS